MRLFVSQKSKTKGWHCMRNQDWSKKRERYISLEEETEMIKRYKKEGNILLIKPIILNQLLQIRKIVQEYLKLTGSTGNFDNFVKIGIFGVIQAIKDYQPHKQIRFSDQAEPHIKRVLIKEAHRVNLSGKIRNIPSVITGYQFRICFNCHRRCLY